MVHGVEKDIRTPQTVSTHPDICCHSVQVSGSVTRLCHDGPVKQGVLCRYGVHGTVSSEITRESPSNCILRAGNQGQ